MVYQLIFFGLLTLCYRTRNSRKYRMLAYKWSLFVLFVFVGFRYEVGCDWTGYEHNFNLNFVEHMTFRELLSVGELGHWYLIYIVRAIGLDYSYLNVIYSFIFFYGFNKLALRQNNALAFLALAFPVLVVNLPMSAIRQAAAVGFFCLSIVSFIDRKLWKYIGYILVGALFHKSVLFFLILFPFVRGGFSRKNISRAAFSTAPIGFLVLASGAADDSIARYSDYASEAAGAIFRLGMLGVAGFFYFSYMSGRWKIRFTRDYKIVHLGSWLMLFLLLLYPLSSVASDRYGYYLIPIQLMIFTRLTLIARGRLKNELILAPYAGLVAIFIVWTMKSNLFMICYTPYQMRLW